LAPWLVLLGAALSASPLDAHDIIDTDQANALVAAVDAAATRSRAAAGSDAEGEAQFALGMALADVTDVLNRDLAAHPGRPTVNAELVLTALAQRGNAPRLDDTIGRYRLPKTPFEEAVRLAPQAPYAARARFTLLKAGFYESFVLDPFELVGIGFEDLQHQIAAAEELAAAGLDAEQAEETAFIHAIDLARAARLAPGPEAVHAYAGKARAALAAFAEAYPDSMRAAAAGMILKRLGSAE
jgi:hypothetical protein